jgi:hypothetical protein
MDQYIAFTDPGRLSIYRNILPDSTLLCSVPTTPLDMAIDYFTYDFEIAGEEPYELITAAAFDQDDSSNHN